jgi:hypothetical protein
VIYDGEMATTEPGDAVLATRISQPTKDAIAKIAADHDSTPAGVARVALEAIAGDDRLAAQLRKRIPTGASRRGGSRPGHRRKPMPGSGED